MQVNASSTLPGGLMQAGRARYHGIGAMIFREVLVARARIGMIISCGVSVAHNAATQLRSLGCGFSVSAASMAR